MTHRPMPPIPPGYRVISVTTPGGRVRWQATKDDGTWFGPDRQSERSAVHDARRRAGL
jgi:hypothetical protein